MVRAAARGRDRDRPTSCHGSKARLPGYCGPFCDVIYPAFSGAGRVDLVSQNHRPSARRMAALPYLGSRSVASGKPQPFVKKPLLKPKVRSSAYNLLRGAASQKRKIGPHLEDQQTFLFQDSNNSAMYDLISDCEGGAGGRTSCKQGRRDSPGRSASVQGIHQELAIGDSLVDLPGLRDHALRDVHSVAMSKMLGQRSSQAPNPQPKSRATSRPRGALAAWPFP